MLVVVVKDAQAIAWLSAIECSSGGVHLKLEETLVDMPCGHRVSLL